MIQLINLTKRNIKVYFSDKGMFFTSLITPIILLILYITFLAGIYRDNFISAIPKGLILPDTLINSLVNGQLISSILSVSCVTVAFTSNLLMAQDRTNKAIKDINVTPTSRFTIGLSYFISTFISTIIVNVSIAIICFIYIYFQGWYMNLSDVLLILLDVFLLTLFGTALSSTINYNLSSQGQITAVGTIVSAGYGFLCGAYMPISSCNVTLQKILSFLPGTYATSLIRNHTLNGPFNKLASLNVPSNVIDVLKKEFDCKITFLGNNVSIDTMYIILILSIIILTTIFILMNKFRKK
mgnify:CR=1 FL=1